MSARYPGGCQCGAVRFSIEEPTKWCAHCHCRMCQRAHGAGVVTWVGVESTQFRIDEGEGVLAWYASSAEAQRGFCPKCGTPMLFRSSRWPGEVHVALACVEKAIDRAPSRHVFYDSHAEWLTLGDDLPRVASTE